MNDIAGEALAAETPVNPYSLLEAVNRAAASTQTAWVIFLALLGYVAVTVAGVSHRDLLLGSGVTLPILDTRVGLVGFFVVVPILVVLLHAALLGQLAALARKALEFDTAVRMLETTDRPTHPLRLELDGFVFVQAVAGAGRSRVVGALLHGLSWLTIVALPAAALLYVQTAFLPYHDAAVTWAHRAALLADVALVACIGVFLLRLETSYFRAFARTTLRHPISLGLTTLTLGAAAYVSLAAATFPGERIHTAGTGGRSGGEPTYAATLFGLNSAPESALFGLFHRSLVLTDADLVGRAVERDAVSLSLRGRDLRFARFDRADLRQADLTGADLEGASLIGADLRGVLMGCAEPSRLALADGRRGAGCTTARGSDFRKAKLAGAQLAGADLRTARFEEADLQGARLGQAVLTGASLRGATLDRADLSGAWLQAAALAQASLHGASLTAARLQMADLAGAALQGADLSGARLQGSDLRGAFVWRTKPHGADTPALADLSQIVLQPPAEEEVTAYTAALGKLESAAVKSRIADGLATLADVGQGLVWASSPEQQQWVALVRASEAMQQAEGYRGRLTEYLARLMCRPRFADGAVASGIARRATAPGTQVFKGDLPTLADRLKGPDCPAAAGVSASVLRTLTAAADSAREPSPPVPVTQARSP